MALPIVLTCHFLCPLLQPQWVEITPQRTAASHKFRANENLARTGLWRACTATSWTEGVLQPIPPSAASSSKVGSQSPLSRPKQPRSPSSPRLHRAPRSRSGVPMHKKCMCPEPGPLCPLPLSWVALCRPGVGATGSSSAYASHPQTHVPAAQPKTTLSGWCTTPRPFSLPRTRRHQDQDTLKPFNLEIGGSQPVLKLQFLSLSTALSRDISQSRHGCVTCVLGLNTLPGEGTWTSARLEGRARQS